jgi:hypothetical protein
LTLQVRSFGNFDPRAKKKHWGRHVEKEGQQLLSASWRSHYNWYEDSVTGERKKPSTDLLEIYFDFGLAASC